MENKRRQATYNDKRVTTNLSHIVERIVRDRILDSLFYKQYLYLTNESTILPIIIQNVKYLAGTDAMGRPSPFICCLLRLLELKPSREIVELCLNQSQFKYLTAIMLTYVRFAFATTEGDVEIYQLLESFYPDYRKLRFQLKYPQTIDGKQLRYTIGYIDDWVYQLLTKERVLDLILPRIRSRSSLEDSGELEVRVWNTGESPTEDENSTDDSDYESDSD
ncbi:pre-mRNA-splicing factor 38 [[Candida] railenensis]|uniref:Pre-mRNA-splicing factor 38 n=1 Tax=[Candida] railenensis TaxID=45579 RepID=A0A9P0QLJ8_9ASCO|nr:pre-mRNA-splicing factor 38 [[Candida] railenensis]